MRYLFFDCETGGLDPEVHSLLTVSFLLTGSCGSKVAALDLLLQPDEGQIVATPEALAINGIDLFEHEGVAIPYSEGQVRLEALLRDVGFDELVPVAHNATFDLGFIWKHLMPRGQWEQRVPGRVIDTCVHWRRFHEREGVRCGRKLQEVAEHYGMAGRYEAHTAGGDVLLMRDLFFHIEGLRSRSGVKAAYP